MKKLLNRDQLKFFVIIPMTLSHIADVFFVPESLATASIWFILFNIIGFMTAPIMCLMMAQGYQYTHNRWNYFFRILLFAVITHIPYIWCHGYSWYGGFNMFFTLAIALLALICYDNIKNRFLKIASIVLLIAITAFTEWCFTAVLWVLVFYIFRDNKKKMFLSGILLFVGQMIVSSCLWHFEMGDSWITAIIYVLIQAIVVAVALLIGLYGCSGKRGRHPKLMKWFFYLYYPLHFAAIGMAAMLLK